MNMSLFQIIAALLMASTAIALVITFRKYRAAGSKRRMECMLERVGLDPAVALSSDYETVMKEVRQRCSTCSTEDVCERWLAGKEEGDNVFCPNAKVFEELLKFGGATG